MNNNFLIFFQNSFLFKYPFRKYQLHKRNKTIIFFILFFIYIPLISKESQIVKIKVNKIDNVKIINIDNIPYPHTIYVNNQLSDSNIETITIENIEDEIKLEWESKLTSCKKMFYELSNIIEIDLSEFDSSDVTDMKDMFNKCTSLKIINLKNLNTEKVTSMCRMFANCSSLTSIDVIQSKTSKVTEMDYMFYACYSLKSLDLSNFDTSSNYFVLKMFMDCFKLKYLNLNGFKTDKIENFNHMFNNCSSLKSLDLSSFNTSLGASSEYMFYGCTSLTSLNISNFKTENNYFMSFMFAGCKNLGYLNFKSICEPENSDDFFNDNILDNTPQNMVMCFTTSKANLLNSIFSQKNCGLLYCNEDWKDKQNKINGETGICMEACNGEFLYQYINKCYKECPEGTEEKNFQFLCEDIIIEIKDDSKINNETYFEEEKFEEKEELEKEEIEPEDEIFIGQETFFREQENEKKEKVYTDICINICLNNKFITPEGDCVTTCPNGTYQFSLNNSCLKSCPNNYKINNYKCIIKSFDKFTKIDEFKNQIRNDITSYVNSSKVINGSNFLAIVLSSDNINPEEQLKNGISAFNLGNCTNVLKEHYDIKKEENLIILNM